MNNPHQSCQGDRAFLGDPYLKGNRQWRLREQIDRERILQSKNAIVQTSDRRSIRNPPLAPCPRTPGDERGSSRPSACDLEFPIWEYMSRDIYRRRRKRAMNSDFGRTIVLELSLDLRPSKPPCAPPQSDIELPTPGCGNPNIPISSRSTLVLRLESRAERHRQL